MTNYMLRTPLSEAEVMKLRVADTVFLSGRIYTARDRAHALLRSKGSPVTLAGAALYHCGPLLKQDKVLSAGPTTSGRMARYTDELLELGVKAIIGKGGLPANPFLKRAVYLAYPGGCGAAASRKLKAINIYFQELGMAEALWEFEADNLGPMVVAIDSHGRDLYQEVRISAQSCLKG